MGMISPQSWKRVRKQRTQKMQHPWRPLREEQDANVQMEEWVRSMRVLGLQAVMRLNHSFRSTMRRVYRTERVTTKLPPREYLCSVRQRRRSRRYRDQMRGRRRQVPLTMKIYMLQENRRCLSCRRYGKVPERSVG